uniref:RRM domain-containing protein n=1 Tax=Syphacia muris TaxID=451379 RepID=A0A0N5ASB5_9BILA
MTDNVLQRGPDDLFTPLQPNGGGLLAPDLAAMAVGTEAKKAKLDSSLSFMPSGIFLPQQNLLSAAVNLAKNPFIAAPQPIIAPPTNANGLLWALLPHIYDLTSFEGSPVMSTSTSTANSLQRPSKVVHLRNMPCDMSDVELINFCLPYGKLVNYLMLKRKNQAFVEYEDEQSAQALVALSMACPIAIRDKTIFCQFSTHQELKVHKIRSYGSANNENDLAASEVSAFLPQLTLVNVCFQHAFLQTNHQAVT